MQEQNHKKYFRKLVEFFIYENRSRELFLKNISNATNNGIKTYRKP